MKQILGVRFSEHGQIVPCVMEAPASAIQDCSAPLDGKTAVMATLEYGQSLGHVVWCREVDDNADIGSMNLPMAGAGDDDERPCRRQRDRNQDAPDKPLPKARLATPEEMSQAENNRSLCREALGYCRRCINERELDMKLVDVETLFDRSKMIFYFTAPTRIDFRDLVKDLVRQYRTRIELRQIGVRHETQMLGALGNCGMVCCCRRYLRKFAPVTIKMAKEQNLFLNPAKISGICGRLLCCLSFEQENYDTFHKACPKLGKRYQTNRGTMRVLRGNMFRNTIIVLPDGGPEVEMSLEEWKAIQPHRPEPQPAPPKEPRPAHNLMVVSASPDTLDRDLAAMEGEGGSGENQERPADAERATYREPATRKKRKARTRPPQENKPSE